VLAGAIFLAAVLLINQYANFYAMSHSSNSVADILLDNLPVVDVHIIFSEGAILFLLLLASILVWEPKYIPFTLKSVAIFFLVRSLSIVLTHVAPYPTEIHIDPTDYIARLSSGYDLFFSAHTGLPFLTAFIFWRKKWLRYFFFACSAVGGAAVLLGHLHYSIDVFSALFISYGIFNICKHLFPKDYQRTA
jgi:hypothetical protein